MLFYHQEINVSFCAIAKKENETTLSKGLRITLSSRVTASDGVFEFLQCVFPHSRPVLLYSRSTTLHLIPSKRYNSK